MRWSWIHGNDTPPASILLSYTKKMKKKEGWIMEISWIMVCGVLRVYSHSYISSSGHSNTIPLSSFFFIFIFFYFTKKVSLVLLIIAATVFFLFASQLYLCGSIYWFISGWMNIRSYVQRLRCYCYQKYVLIILLLARHLAPNSSCLHAGTYLKPLEILLKADS